MEHLATVPVPTETSTSQVAMRISYTTTNVLTYASGLELQLEPPHVQQIAKHLSHVQTLTARQLDPYQLRKSRQENCWWSMDRLRELAVVVASESLLLPSSDTATGKYEMLLHVHYLPISMQQFWQRMALMLCQVLQQLNQSEVSYQDETQYNGHGPTPIYSRQMPRILRIHSTSMYQGRQVLWMVLQLLEHHLAIFCDTNEQGAYPSWYIRMRLENRISAVGGLGQNPCREIPLIPPAALTFNSTNPCCETPLIPPAAVTFNSTEKGDADDH
jgi:hypothetical protein